MLLVSIRLCSPLDDIGALGYHSFVVVSHGATNVQVLELLSLSLPSDVSVELVHVPGSLTSVLLGTIGPEIASS